MPRTPPRSRKPKTMTPSSQQLTSHLPDEAPSAVFAQVTESLESLSRMLKSPYLEEEFGEKLREMYKIVGSVPIDEKLPREKIDKLVSLQETIWQDRLNLVFVFAQQFAKSVDIEFIKPMVSYDNLKQKNLSQLIQELDQHILQAQDHLEKLKSREPEKSARVSNQKLLVKGLQSSKKELLLFKKSLEQLKDVSSTKENKKVGFERAEERAKKIVFPAAGALVGTLVGVISAPGIILRDGAIGGIMRAGEANYRINKAFNTSSNSLVAASVKKAMQLILVPTGIVVGAGVGFIERGLERGVPIAGINLLLSPVLGAHYGTRGASKVIDAKGQFIYSIIGLEKVVRSSKMFDYEPPPITHIDRYAEILADMFSDSKKGKAKRSM